MERLAATEDGRVEVSGRWFGVRGRRFVRPALTLTLGDGVPERRCLAELEHKPWAAQDGEPWMAAFPVDVDLGAASTIELSVAPDIEITLRSPAGSTGAAGESSVAAEARSPLAKQHAWERRPSARAQDLERMTTRLSSAEAALERERERRAGVQQALEEQRAESRRLNAELGRARAELDLARTVQREGEASATELDSTRREVRALERRYEELAQEHARMIEAHAGVQSELRERSGALESARDALGQERERGAAAVAAERARGADAINQEQTRPSDELGPERQRRTEELAQERARVADRRRGAPARAPATEAFVPVYDDEAAGGDPEPPPDERRTQDQAHEPRARTAVPPRSERSVNPALSARANWFGRVLALLVIAAVVLAIWLVLHSTVLH